MDWEFDDDEIVIEVEAEVTELEVTEEPEIVIVEGDGGAFWGSIGGRLDNQTDLAEALSGKSDTDHTHDDRYYTEQETDTKLSGKSDTDHTHDDRYYTESEVDTKLSGKSDVGHVHDERYYTQSEINAALAIIDSALAGKSDVGHIHDDRYYTESEIDAALAVINTALAGKSNTGHTHDDRYYTESEVDTKLSGKSDTGHDHDGRYYTEQETDTKLSGKSDTGHDHDGRYYTESEIDTALLGKQNTLTFDTTPISGSTNPVTSGGLYDLTKNIIRIDDPFRVVDSNLVELYGVDNYLLVCGKVVFLTIRFTMKQTTSTSSYAMAFKPEYMQYVPSNYYIDANGIVFTAAECWSAATQGMIYLNDYWSIGISGGFVAGRTYIGTVTYFIN